MEYTSESSLPHVRGCIQKFPDWVDNEIYTYNNKHMLRSNTKGYDGKTHWTGSQNSNTTAPSDREQYHLQFLLQEASPETFGYTLVLAVKRWSLHILIIGTHQWLVEVMFSHTVCYCIAHAVCPGGRLATCGSSFAHPELTPWSDVFFFFRN